MPKTVKDIMTKDPIVITAPTTRKEVLRILISNAIMGAPIVDQEGNFLGIITRRDLIEKPGEEQVGLIMRRNVPTVSPDDSVEEAARIMHGWRRRHLVVVSEGKVVGLLTPHHFLQVIYRRKISTPVQEYMANPIPVYHRMPLRVLFKMMGITKTGAFPVLDDEGNLVGIVTDRDLFPHTYVDASLNFSDFGLGADEDAWTWEGLRDFMRLFYMERKLKLPDISVEEVMVRDIKTIFFQSPAWEAAKTMYKNDFNQLPVRDANDELIGMLFDIDLLAALVSEDEK